MDSSMEAGAGPEAIVVEGMLLHGWSDRGAIRFPKALMPLQWARVAAQSTCVFASSTVYTLKRRRGERHYLTTHSMIFFQAGSKSSRNSFSLPVCKQVPPHAVTSLQL